MIYLELNKVYTIKINSGEELITKITGIDGDWTIISDPVSIAPGPKGLGLVPSMFTADLKEKIRLNMNNVAFIALTEDAVKMKYIEATTGITVPDKKLILG